MRNKKNIINRQFTIYMVIAYGSRRRCWLNTSGTLFNVSKYFACGCGLSNNHDTKRTISPRQLNGSCVRLAGFGDFGDHAVVCCVSFTQSLKRLQIFANEIVCYFVEWLLWYGIPSKGFPWKVFGFCDGYSPFFLVVVVVSRVSHCMGFEE